MTPLADAVEALGFWEPNTGCLLWGGRLSDKGYPLVSVGRKTLRVTRVVLGEKLGRRLDRAELACHTCDVRACCNAAHLFAGTNLDNARDKCAKGRQARVHGPRKLTRRDASNIRRSKRTVAWLAAYYDVSERQIERIRAGKSHAPLKWLNYEQGKAQIAATAQSPAEYEARLMQLTDALGV